MRVTDADWQLIAQSEPHWGVLTHDRFKAENLRPETLDEFYQTGAQSIKGTTARLASLVGAKFPVGRALDFGCGAGRLTFGMAEYADEVIGKDIAAGMIDAASKR